MNYTRQGLFATLSVLEEDMAKKSKSGSHVLGDNRKARFNYTIIETLECGIMLKGTEVKSIKAGKFSFPDAFAEIRRGELFIQNLQITPYTHGSVFNHKESGPRKLLAHRREIDKLERKVREKGITLIPLKFYIVKGRVKVEIGLCKGKKQYDKRATIKDRDLNRDAERDLKKY